MADERDSTAYVKGLLKAEPKRLKVSYRVLADKLGALEVHKTE